MENTYGIGIANRYELFYDQDDVTEFETVTTKKKEKKVKEPAQQQTTAPANGVQQKSAAEKENKAVKKENGPGQVKASVDQQPRRGIKEQQNNSNKDNSTRKEGGELKCRCRARGSQEFPYFGKFLSLAFLVSRKTSSRVCAAVSVPLGKNCVNFPREKCVKVHLRKKKVENVPSTSVNVLVRERTRITFFPSDEKVNFGRDWLRKGDRSGQISKVSGQACFGPPFGS